MLANIAGELGSGYTGEELRWLLKSVMHETGESACTSCISIYVHL